tara:strand:- start:950 stop:1621 length:672 start_codon:yes stop_codon:yes gene_type:complete
MHQQTNKKLLIYLFLFFLLGTINNKNLSNFEFTKIKEIKISGLKDEEITKLTKNIGIIKLKNLFFLNRFELDQIMNKNNLIEKYSIFKKYPNTLEIKIDKTNFIANVYIGNNFFYLGSNGKLINTIEKKIKVPSIFGNFEISKFFELKYIIDNSNLKYGEIDKLFFFKSGRWDIQTNSGILIKLPVNKQKESLDILNNFLNNPNFKNIKTIDIRQVNQVILSE